MVKGTLPERRSPAAAWAASMRSCAALEEGKAPIWMFQVAECAERSSAAPRVRLAGSIVGAAASDARAGLTVVIVLPGAGTGTVWRITNRLSLLPTDTASSVGSMGLRPVVPKSPWGDDSVGGTSAGGASAGGGSAGGTAASSIGLGGVSEGRLTASPSG